MKYRYSETGTGLFDMENTKLRYCVNKRNFFARFCALLLGLSVILILLSGWGFWNNKDMLYFYLQILLPAVSCILFIVVINHMGEKGFTLTFIPVICAAAYLIINSADKAAPLHSVLCIALCIVVTLAYIMTLFGVIGSKWLMLPIVGLPLAYRIVVEYLDMFTKAEGLTLNGEFLQELAILCMVFSLFIITFAMKKRDFSKKEKPIEEVLVELELNPDGNAPEAENALPEEIQAPIQTENEAVIIAPSGEQHE